MSASRGAKAQNSNFAEMREAVLRDIPMLTADEYEFRFQSSRPPLSSPATEQALYESSLLAILFPGGSKRCRQRTFRLSVSAPLAH